MSECVQGIEHGNAHRQREIYDLLEESDGMTAREVGNEIGQSADAARSIVQKLRRDGYVTTRPDLRYPRRKVYEVPDDE